MDRRRGAGLGVEGLAGWRDDAAAREAARSDWSGLAGAPPRGVLAPASLGELAAALAACDRARQPVVPQGGRTGLAGGATCRAGDVALSLERFAGVEEVDRDSGVLICRAGTVLAEAQAAAEAEGFLLPLDLGARGSCRIGGNVSTNAGGLRVIRHGTLAANLLGLEAVLADGTVAGHLGRSLKRAMGPDMRGLMLGAEGTLGVVARVALRLVPLPAARLTALVALPGDAALAPFLARARQLPGLSAFEAMWADHLAWNEAAEGVRPFAATPPLAVLLEAETDAGPAEAQRFEDLLGAALEAGEATDAVLPRSGRETAGLWALREGLRMDAAMPGLMNLDIALPPGRLAGFAEAARAAVAQALPGMRLFRYGHAGDGNLHLSLWQPGMDDALRHRIDAVIYPLVPGFGGAISAEHGIGLMKRDWAHLSRSAEERAVLARVKAALDPNGIMNPGKLL